VCPERSNRSGQGIVIGDWRNNVVRGGLRLVLGALVGLLLIRPEAGNAPEISALSAPMNEALTPGLCPMTR